MELHLEIKLVEKLTICISLKPAFSKIYISIWYVRKFNKLNIIFLAIYLLALMVEKSSV